VKLKREDPRLDREFLGSEHLQAVSEGGCAGGLAALLQRLQQRRHHGWQVRAVRHPLHIHLQQRYHPAGVP